MRIPRIYLPITLIPGHSIELDPQSAHHVRSVLRLKAGDSVQLFNGGDCQYAAIVTRISKKSVLLEVGEVSLCLTESALA
ncbi:MAG: RNA methyltransferase PUA domain-containing protein, partial [Methylococcales bacterium]